MNDAPEKVTGHCYCKAIQFEIALPSVSCSHCHCEDCRGTHGSAFATWVSFFKTQFKILQGESLLNRYESHPGIIWGFCKNCGPSLLNETVGAPNNIYITLSNIHDPIDRRPKAHYRFEEHVSWFHPKDETPKTQAKTNQPYE
jgi:hypothetical protein